MGVSESQAGGESVDAKGSEGGVYVAVKKVRASASADAERELFTSPKGFHHFFESVNR